MFSCLISVNHYLHTTSGPLPDNQPQQDSLHLVNFITDDMVLDGPGDILGFGSVSLLVTNFSIDPVMTRNPSYKQIKIYFGLNGKLHNKIYVNTSLTKIKMQLQVLRSDGSGPGYFWQ